MNTNQFTIKGKKFLHKIYNHLHKRALKKANRLESKKDSYSDKTIEVKQFSFFNHKTIFIKYKVLETNKTHQIVMEGDYIDLYKEYARTKEVPERVDLEKVIRNKHNNSTIL